MSKNAPDKHGVWRINQDLAPFGAWVAFQVGVESVVMEKRAEFCTLRPTWKAGGIVCAGPIAYATDEIKFTPGKTIAVAHGWARDYNGPS